MSIPNADSPHRHRYALIGAGTRAQMYLEAMAGEHRNSSVLAAWSDTNQGRLDWNERWLVDAGLEPPERFTRGDLAATVARLGIERVIVTAPDFVHADLVVASLEAGADVIVEKPLTTDEDGIRRISDAVERTGRSVIVTFNYRYSPRNALLREIVSSGEIGDVTSIHFEWLLDTSHGADYFRRWHREKANSGGLLVHKSSHHFDLVNWWISDSPWRVFASGGLRFYGAENAARRGLGSRPPRGTTDPAHTDPFGLDLRSNELLCGLFYEQEHYDGYIRDRDVFSDGITIEDNMSVLVDYAAGASLTYSLNAHAPWEGYVVGINGTQGRAELTVVERGAHLAEGTQVVDPSASSVEAESWTERPDGERLLVQRHFTEARQVPIPEARGGHGGADSALLRDLFEGGGDDVLGQRATWTDGVRAMAVGVAANRSMDDGAPHLIGDVTAITGRAGSDAGATTRS